MARTKKNQNPDALPTSIRLPADLQRKLLQKSKELGNIGISKTILILLDSALKASHSDRTFKYMVLIHSLIQESLMSLVEDAESLIDRAERKAEKIIIGT